MQTDPVSPSAAMAEVSASTWLKPRTRAKKSPAALPFIRDRRVTTRAAFIGSPAGVKVRVPASQFPEDLHGALDVFVRALEKSVLAEVRRTAFRDPSLSCLVPGRLGVFHRAGEQALIVPETAFVGLQTRECR